MKKAPCIKKRKCCVQKNVGKCCVQKNKNTGTTISETTIQSLKWS